MSTQLEEPARSVPQRWPVIVAFALIWGGLMSTEQLSIHLLPTTIEEFTKSPWLIGVILALNPAFGVIAQPIAGILGDKIWTPVGRRAFFLITGAPIVGLCLWLIPEARLLWHIIVLVLLYQFFQDVMWGSDHPLMADLFPPKQRLFVSGMLITAGNLTGWIFMKFGMGNLNSGNLSSDELYRLVAVLQVVLVSGLSFFLNEKPVVKKDRPKLTLKRYAADLFGHPIRRRFAALYFFISLLMNIAVLGGFLALFAKNNLGATNAQYGETFSVSALPPLFLSIPVALLIERYLSKRAALIGGIVALISALSIGWTAQSIDQLFWLAILWGLGYMLIIGTFKPFFSEYVASDIIGQISGALNICWGVARLLAVLVTGFAIDFIFDDNYRFIFPLAIAMGCIALYLAFSIPDLRFEARKADQKGTAN